MRPDTCVATAAVKSEVEDFMLDNDLPAYFLGVSQELARSSLALLRGQALWLRRVCAYSQRRRHKDCASAEKGSLFCRFAPADIHGKISKIIYTNWRKCISSRKDIEVIDLLDPASPWRDLQDKLAKKSKIRKFAVVSRIPTVDSTYYPIPYYAALFKGKWYNIKQLIGIAKEAKLRNSAPIKYHIEVGTKYWESIFRAEGITDRSCALIKDKSQSGSPG